MVAKLARDDFEDLRAQGLNPTLEDFDLLNQRALPLQEGAETTSANFPRVGWAGDIPFFEPTIAAFAWYHEYAVRLAANAETENTFWAFALAHAREPAFFNGLYSPEAIEHAVTAWANSLPVTREEIFRACRYAVNGFDDAATAKDETGNPRFRADRSAAARNLANLEAQLRRACVALKCLPDALMGETQTRLAALCEGAAVELGRPMSKDEARLRAEYDLTLRRITLRLREESLQRKDEHDRQDDGTGNVDGHVPSVTGPDPSCRVPNGTPREEPKEAIIAAHGENCTISDAGRQE